MEWEAQFLLWLEQFRSPFMNTFWVIISYAGLVVLFAPIAYFVIKKEYRLKGICILCSLAIAFIICNVCLKIPIHRARPYETWEMLTPVLHPIDSSFPSGHTNASFAVAFAYLILINKKIGIPAIVFASLIAISRLYMGVHYPTDILGGMICALVGCIIATKFIYPWLKERIVQ